ncbi:uncharacterized [Tachysurus ichikawai]
MYFSLIVPTRLAGGWPFFFTLNSIQFAGSRKNRRAFRVFEEQVMTDDSERERRQHGLEERESRGGAAAAAEHRAGKHRR